jgi:thiol-disulfide isomerase/thioredoxin
VLVDFWTYSCINCLRTLPYLESWDARYRSKGLVIVGVHSPEFAFEHSLGNVRAAVHRLGIRYPSRSTTTSRRGPRTRTSTGRRTI